MGVVWEDFLEEEQGRALLWLRHSAAELEEGELGRAGARE